MSKRLKEALDEVEKSLFYLCVCLLEGHDDSEDAERLQLRQALDDYTAALREDVAEAARREVDRRFNERASAGSTN